MFQLLLRGLRFIVRGVLPLKACLYLLLLLLLLLTFLWVVLDSIAQMVLFIRFLVVVSHWVFDQVHHCFLHFRVGLFYKSLLLLGLLLLPVVLQVRYVCLITRVQNVLLWYVREIKAILLVLRQSWQVWILGLLASLALEDPINPLDKVCCLRNRWALRMR
jgi:hypothetical protein